MVLYLSWSGYSQSDVLILFKEEKNGFLWVMDFKAINLCKQKRRGER